MKCTRCGWPTSVWRNDLVSGLCERCQRVDRESPGLDPQAAATQALYGHAADLFETTRAITAAAGLPAYETSNHARIGAESRHNLTYWRYGDYAGIGPGAHGRREGVATARRKKPENWMSAVDRNGHGIELEETLPPTTRATEALVMGLRLAEGVDLSRVTALAEGREMVNHAAIGSLAQQGLVRLDGERLIVTEAGALLLDAILREVVLTDD